MRTEPESPYRSATLLILIANVLVYLIQAIAEFYSRGRGIDLFIKQHLALSVSGLAHLQIWQLVTFQFLHGSLLHLIFNCWALYTFGQVIEQEVGRNRFTSLYLASGVIGGLLQVALSALVPQHFGGYVVGASAGVFGLVAAFARFYPERPLTLLLFLIIPFSMRAKFLLYIAAGLAVFGILVPGDNVAHAAHLGGMIAGVVFVYLYLKNPDWSFSWPSFAKRSQPTRELVGTVAGKSSWQASKSTPVPELAPEEFISREVDPILDKISAHGIQSLTPKERQILEAARSKMARR